MYIYISMQLIMIAYCVFHANPRTLVHLRPSLTITNKSWDHMAMLLTCIYCSQLKLRRMIILMVSKRILKQSKVGRKMWDDADLDS